MYKIEDDRRIKAYCHIPKVAGSSITYMLKASYGARHFGAISRSDNIPGPLKTYTKKDLETDLKIYPGVISISGHCLKPYVDFGEYEKIIDWYTMIRNPVHRLISHYQYQVELLGEKRGMLKWMTDNKKYEMNKQVSFIAGEQDLEAAKQIISDKVQFVGLLEHYIDSICLIKQRLNMPELITTLPEQRRNQARSKANRKTLNEQSIRFIDDIMEYNLLDIELYDHVEKKLWHNYKKNVSVVPEILRSDSYWKIQNSLISNIVKRNIIYKPYVYFNALFSRKDM